MSSGNDNTITLEDAINLGDSDAVRKLLADGADININVRGDSGDTALIRAARNGNTEVLRALLEAGADTNHRNEAGESALDVAIENPEVTEAITSFDPEECRKWRDKVRERFSDGKDGWEQGF